MIEARPDDEPTVPDNTGEASSFSSSSSSSSSSPPPPPRSSLTDDYIVSMAVLFFLAGFDTTSSTHGFASYLLAINPEKQDKLCAAIYAYYENKDEVGE